MKTFHFINDISFEDTKTKTNGINLINSFSSSNSFSEEKVHPDLSLDNNESYNSNFFMPTPLYLPNHSQNDISSFYSPEEFYEFLSQNLSLIENPSPPIQKQEETSTKNKKDSDSIKNNKFEIMLKDSKAKYFRVDSAKKHFKVAISRFATKKLNSLIKESHLPKRLKKKIHLPHNKLFTSNPKEYDNFQFLSLEWKEILILGNTGQNLQGNNKAKISEILNYKKNPEKTKEIIEFLSLKYEDIIKLFYESKEFQKFKEDETTKFYEEGIQKEKNISLLKDNGLIKLFKMTNKKRKREMFIC